MKSLKYFWLYFNIQIAQDFKKNLRDPYKTKVGKGYSHLSIEIQNSGRNINIY